MVTGFVLGQPFRGLLRLNGNAAVIDGLVGPGQFDS